MMMMMRIHPEFREQIPAQFCQHHKCNHSHKEERFAETGRDLDLEEEEEWQ